MVKFQKSSIKYTAASTILILLMTLTFLVSPEHHAVPIIAFLVNLVFLVKFRKSLPIFLLFAFFSLYTYEAIKANNLGIKVSAWPHYNSTDLIHKVIFLNGFFLYAFGNWLDAAKVSSKMVLESVNFKSYFLFWPLCLVGLLMIHFGIRGDTLFEAGEYGQGHVERSTMHEYFILVYFLLLLVAPKGFLIRVVLALMLLVYIAKTILYGGRIEVLEIILLVSFYYWILEAKINKTLVYCVAICGYYLSSVFQQLRGNPLPFLQGNYSFYLNPFKVAAIEDRKYLASNQGDVLHSSARFIGLMEDGFITLYQRIAGFIYMLLSVVFPSSMAPDYSNLSGYRRDLAGAGGGGLIGAYFYIWMSYAGPFIIGGFLAYFINKGFSSKHIGYKVYAVILLVMFPRWYAYNPLHIFKFCFLTVVVYQLVRIFFNSFLRKSSPFLDPMR